MKIIKFAIFCALFFIISTMLGGGIMILIHIINGSSPQDSSTFFRNTINIISILASIGLLELLIKIRPSGWY